MPDKWQHDMFEQHAGEHRGQSSGTERRGENRAKLLISNLDFGVSDTDIQVIYTALKLHGVGVAVTMTDA